MSGRNGSLESLTDWDEVAYYLGVLACACVL